MTISGIPIPSFRVLVNSLMNKSINDLLWFNNKNGMSLYYFSKGTWALKKGIELLLDKNGIKNGKIFVPSYICFEPLIPIKNDNINIHFYSINNDLSPNWEKLESFVQTKFIPDVFVLVHYFGFKNEIKRATDFCKKYNIELIQDAAHIFLPFEGLFNNITIYSPRKFLPIPEGGILAIPKNIVANAGSTDIYRSDVFFMMKWILQISIKKLLIILKFSWRKIIDKYKKNSNDIYEDISKQYPISFSIKLIKSLQSNFNQIVVKRRDNYKLLFNKLSKIDGIEILFPDLPSDVCPFMMPILVFDNRDTILEHLKYNGIPAISWPELPGEVLNNKSRYKNTIMLNENIILLPIHQDITRSNIIYMQDTLKKKLKSCETVNTVKN